MTLTRPLFTDADHIVIGSILGFPECCVTSWVEAPSGLKGRVGGYTERNRRPGELSELCNQVSAFLGREWRCTDERKHYVPCLDCAARLEREGKFSPSTPVEELRKLGRVR